MEMEDDPSITTDDQWKFDVHVYDNLKTQKTKLKEFLQAAEDRHADQWLLIIVGKGKSIFSKWVRRLLTNMRVDWNYQKDRRTGRVNVGALIARIEADMSQE